MSTYVLPLRDIDRTMAALAGGKGANLGELTRIGGIRVPDGCCVTTEAYRRVTAHLDLSDASAYIRTAIETAAIPVAIADEIAAYIEEGVPYAVRSSATAEDLPTASFAGQQDTYLNIIGKEAVLQHVGKCWASLYTDRAVAYRKQNSFDDPNVHLAVVVQKMVAARTAGVLFTADPVTSNRKVVSIDAGFGLGETLVSGLVNSDVYTVRDGTIVRERDTLQALTDEHILELEQIGRKIEAHFKSPQDIEWCISDAIYIVQSRPITTLYPIPQAPDKENRVYLSVGHQQMMTDAMKPLGISIKQLNAFRPMYEAGGRLFVDVTDNLSTTSGRKSLIDLMAQHDPLMKDAVTTLVERDFIKLLPEDAHTPQRPSASHTQTDSDPAIVTELIERGQASIAEVKQAIRSKSGVDLLDFILEDIQELKKILFDRRSFGVFMAAIDASAWINEKMNDWLGEKNAADVLTQSVPNNVTSEMGLALLDVADAIRPYPEIIAYLQETKDDNFLDGLPRLEGGPQTQKAFREYLDKYGMRCVGEIDITKPRWSEKPSMLLPLILSNIKNFEPGAARRKFDQGLQEASQKERSLLEALQQLPDGEQKAKETKHMISLIRNFMGYREYPKYFMVSRYFIYKQAMMKEAERLAQSGAIPDKEDVYYLTLEELREAARTQILDYETIAKRKAAFKTYEKLSPPRVITSDGEILTGSYNRKNLPPDTLAGLAVSSGVIEGRARIILDIKDADLAEGDILVTAYTDPSWTPLFVSLKGLVTEVGGLMTHGAVIAREYGLPAVVGVENATRLIKDGQRIRVNGTDGYVEPLTFPTA
ncbi:MAG TPA: phosphoenolpyruvate synthase [Dinghuibacter sp.]|uniref:phosphoenolpyruvate synthase n=1 Tax=Dinghuibacter sp. TaxID=2024697 RepID=UPI002C4F46C4|nr:phosphoenolpyruvate synthase [Dinghuibacter sp.]HTJ11475.1 phosphoenolpyruvate synthase [Dinghuibacter sp.]